MPTKRQFDMAVLVVILIHPVVGLAKIWATRKQTDPSAGVVSKIGAGAVQIVS